MEPTFWTFFKEFGLAGIAIGANIFIVMVFMKFLTNHMACVTKSLDALTKTTDAMAHEIKHCHERSAQ